MSARDKRGGPMALEAWARHQTEGYNNCSIKNMTTSFRNGMAFCALIHKFRPDLINYDDLDPNDIIGNCTLAFETAERHLGIPALLDPMDMLALEVPDRLSVLTYVAQYYHTFKNMESRKLYNGSSSLERKSGNHSTTTAAAATLITSKRTLDIEDEALNEARKKLSGNSSPVMLRNNTTCSVCQNPVYITERILFNKKLYHRSCFRCFNCNHILNPQTADISSDGLLLFCLENTCFVELQKRSRESKLNVTDSNSSTTTNTNIGLDIKAKAEPIVKVKRESANGGSPNKENNDYTIGLPNVSALKKSFENGSIGSSSSGVSSEAQSLDYTIIANQASDEKIQIHEPTIRFDETVTVKSSSEEVNANNEIVPVPKIEEEVLKSADDDDTSSSVRKDLHESPSQTSIQSDPSDTFVLRPDSSLTSQIQQREEEDIVRRNTAVNQVIARTDLRTTSGIDIKPVKEMPNVYRESTLPVAQSLERNVQKLDVSKKSHFLSRMLDDDGMNESAEKKKVETQNTTVNTEPVAVEVEVKSEIVEPKPDSNVKAGPEIKLELEPGTEVVVKQEVEEPQVRIEIEPVETTEINEESEDISPPPPVTAPMVSKSEIITSISQKSPGPSPVPRRKSPAPSTTSTTSTMSLTETANTSSPAPTPRRVKTKPPRPALPSKASLTSLTSKGSAAKELWKKENYYPAELNPFESEEDLPTRTNSTSQVVTESTAPTSTTLPSNPFEEDEEEESQPQPIPSPTPSPRIRSARNQVNSITESRHRSRSRSKSRSPSRKSQMPAPPPSPSPRVPRPASMPAPETQTTIKAEPKPYNPFEDDDDETAMAEADESGMFSPEVTHRRQGSETSSGASSSISTTPVPKARQSLPSTSTLTPPSSEVGSVRKSNKTKRAPLPPTQSFTAPSSSNRNPEHSSGTSTTVTPPRSPKSILKQTSNPDQTRLIPSSSSTSPKKVIPASPDLLRGLKNKPKKKRRAPPPRRRVEALPEEAIKTEMNDLIVKERELERQGITLESNIRRLMEQQESSVGFEDGTGTSEGVVNNTEQQVDEMMVQLWNIVNEKNDILRRQTELEYLRRGHSLEEMQAELEFKLRILMDTPVHERQDDYAQVEQSLLDELLKLVDERNDVVEWLDFHRKQDREEDALLSDTLTSYSTTSSLQRQTSQDNAPVELIKEDGKSKSKMKKDKQKQKEKDKNKDKDKEKQSSNNKIEGGEKIEKEKKSKFKTLLFGKKKHKSSSLKNGHDQEPELPLPVEETKNGLNGSESISAEENVNSNTELQK